MKVRITLFIPDVVNAAGDPVRFAERIHAAGGDAVLIFGMSAFPEAGRIGKLLLPYGQDGAFTHDSGRTYPRFRLLKRDAAGRLVPNWNQAYLDRVRLIRGAFIKNGIERDLAVNDIRRKSEPSGKYFHPYYCSVEALGPETPGGVWGRPGQWPMRRYHASFTAMAISRWWPRKVKAVNEYNSPSFATGDDGKIDPVQEAYMTNVVLPDLCRMILRAGRVKEVWTSGSIAAARAAKAQGVLWGYSWHGVSTADDIPDDIAERTGFPTSRIVVSCDGGTKGHGDPDAKGRRGPSVAEAVGIVKRARELGIPEVVMSYRGFWFKNNGWADLDAFKPDVLAASAEEGDK